MKIDFSPEEVKAQFRISMVEMNAEPDDRYELKANGQLQRYHIKGDKQSSKNGAYVLHMDGYPAGFIQNWKGEKISWKFNAEHSSLTQEQREYLNSPEYQKEIAEKQRKQDEERRKLHEEAAEQARIAFESYIDSPEIQHPYLNKKNVKIYGARFKYQKAGNPEIAVPLYNINGNIQSLQWIDKDGNKKFYHNASTSGAFFHIGLNSLKDDEPILICEGFATGSKIHQLTGLPTVCAMNCDNVSTVTKAFKTSTKYKDRQIIIMADNDIETAKAYQTRNGVAFNPGIDAGQKAVKAGNAIGYIAPPFNQENPEGSDWDDYALTYGDEKAAEVINEKIKATLETKRNEVMTMNNTQNAYSVAPLQNAKRNVQNDINAEKPYRGFSFAECCKNPTPTKWRIKKLIPEKGVGMFFGASGSYKSFLSTDIGASIACPEIEAWNGHKIKHGHVIYFAGEGAEGLKKRCAGWAVERGINPENVQFDIIEESFSFDVDTQEYNTEKTISEIKKRTAQPALIILDTLNRYMGGDENKAVDVSKMLQATDRLIKEFNCAILIIHHTGVSENAQDRARGSSALKAALDFEMQIVKTGEKRAMLKQTKNKDDATQKPMCFDLKTVIIPECYDEDGEPVDTLVPELNETLTQIEATQKTKEKKLPPIEKFALETYSEAAQKHGGIIKENETGEECVALEIEDWRKIIYARSSSEKDSTRRGQFNKARNKLTEEKRLLFAKQVNGKLYFCLYPTGDSYENLIKTAIIERQKNLTDTTGELF